MERSGRWAWACGTLLVLLAGVVQAQGLAEAAAKERARRKGKTPAKVYTENDLGSGSGSVGSSDGAAGEGTPAEGGEAGAKPAAASQGSSEDPRAAEEKAWRDNVSKMQADLERQSTQLADLENQANDTRGLAYGTRRQILIENLEKARADRSAAQGRLEAALEEGRRKGFRAP